MFIAKVVGNVWATRKHPSLEGKKLMLICPVDGMKGTRSGPVQLAIDHSMDAGPGDTVLIIDEGSSCRQMMGAGKGPTRTIIAGIVDSVSAGNKTKKYH
ncbi:MAG: EutN/CcmL family microcompartment protein [Elusimicrobia bacterium]|nr:EutN/CcmL family microcompartment protein [Elusimicrobiota bacterium]